MKKRLISHRWSQSSYKYNFPGHLSRTRGEDGGQIHLVYERMNDTYILSPTPYSFKKIIEHDKRTSQCEVMCEWTRSGGQMFVILHSLSKDGPSLFKRDRSSRQEIRDWWVTEWSDSQHRNDIPKQEGERRLSRHGGWWHVFKVTSTSPHTDVQGKICFF